MVRRSIAKSRMIRTGPLIEGVRSAIRHYQDPAKSQELGIYICGDPGGPECEGFVS